MAAKYQTWSASANLSDGEGETTDIELTEGSEFFLVRPLYGSGGNDPALGGFAIFRKSDFDGLTNQGSNTPTISESPGGDYILIAQLYNEEATADFGFFGLFRRNNFVGIVSKATSLSPEIIGVEIYEYVF